MVDHYMFYDFDEKPPYLSMVCLTFVAYLVIMEPAQFKIDNGSDATADPSSGIVTRRAKI